MDRISDGEQLFIIVELPPQHGKSTYITETFPTFYLAKNPDKLAMVVSYSEELYKKFGRKNRELFRLYSDALFNLKISTETASVSEWGIDGHLGQLYCTSILGGATGRGTDLLIVDDPVKNRAEAEKAAIIDYSQYSMEKGGEQLPLSVSTILGGTIKKIKKEVNSSSSFKVHVPPKWTFSSVGRAAYS